MGGSELPRALRRARIQPVESSSDALKRIHHQARSALTAAQLAMQGLANAALEERDLTRLKLARESLKRLAGLLTEMEATFPLASSSEPQTRSP
jgi:hypothetical protein